MGGWGCAALRRHPHPLANPELPASCIYFSNRMMVPGVSSFAFVSKGRRGKKLQEVLRQKQVRALPAAGPCSLALIHRRGGLTTHQATQGHGVS